MKPIKINHRLLATSIAAVSLAVVSILSVQAQVVVLDENFNRGTLGGAIGPAPTPNTTGLTQIHDIPLPGYGPNSFPNDYGVVVDDLRGEVGGKALKFNDKVADGALRMAYGLEVLEDSAEKSQTGILSIGWDFSFDKVGDEVFGSGKIPLQFAFRANDGAYTSIDFLVFSEFNNGENKFHFLVTNSDSSASSRSYLFDDHMFDIEDGEVYRVELNLNLETKFYSVNLFVGDEATPSWTESGLKFVNNGWDYFIGNNLNFQGGSPDFLVDVGGESGLVMDNLLVTYTIPESRSVGLLLLTGCLLGFTTIVRRRIKY